jgi:hypothetical protein
VSLPDQGRHLHTLRLQKGPRCFYGDDLFHGTHPKLQAQRGLLVDAEQEIVDRRGRKAVEAGLDTVATRCK